MGWFSRKPKGRERVIRADYRSLPMEEWTDDEYDHFMQTCTDDEYWAEWDAWSRATVDHPRVKRVRQGVLRMALEAGKASFPGEFGALLRVEGDTVTELILLPGTISGDEHCILPVYNAPVDKTIRGSLHSHPDPHPYPSDADLELFSHHGDIHIIVGQPYGRDDWRAYDHKGQPVHLKVVA